MQYKIGATASGHYNDDDGVGGYYLKQTNAAGGYYLHYSGESSDWQDDGGQSSVPKYNG